jgi:hypothetical protein
VSLVSRLSDGTVVAKHLLLGPGLWIPSGHDSAWLNLTGLKTTEDPAIVSPSADRLEVFVRAPGGGVSQRSWTAGGSGGGAGGWSGAWRALGGGGVRGSVAAVATGGGRVSLFARSSTDGRVRHREWTGAAWQPASAYDSLGSSLTTTAPPFAVPVVSADGRPVVGGFVVFARSSTNNNRIFAKVRSSAASGTWLPAGRAGAWEDLGGAGGALSGPLAVASPGRIDVFVRGAAGDVKHKWLEFAADGGGPADYASSQWQPSMAGEWVSLGGPAGDRPSAAFRALPSPAIDLFIRADGNGLLKVRTLDLTTGRWSASWGTTLGTRRVAPGGGAPTAVALAPPSAFSGRVDVFCRTKDDGRPQHAWFAGGRWYPGS